jgi:hypothetical protein
MGNGDLEIIVLEVQGKQLGNVMFVFDDKYSALPDLADVNSDISSCKNSLAGNGWSLTRGVTPRTTASRLARRERPINSGLTLH